MINIPEKNISRRGIFTKQVIKEIEEPKPKKKRFNFHFKKFSFKKKESHSKVFRNKKKWVIGSLVAVVLLTGGVGYGIYDYMYQNDPRIIYQKKLKTLTQEVSQSVSLPSNETPVTATVSNVSKLPDEAFFKNARDGDKILMYKKDKLAVLYRPTTGKVITEATLDFENVVPTPKPQATAVAGASTSAQLAPQVVIGTPGPTVAYVPQGKILVQPPQQ
jgi:hypothetical protein